MRSAQSPRRSYLLAFSEYTSTMCLIVLVRVFQRGGSLGMYATTTLENLGMEIRLETLPPTIRATPSPSPSEMGRAGHMV